MGNVVALQMGDDGGAMDPEALGKLGDRTAVLTGGHELVQFVPREPALKGVRPMLKGAVGLGVGEPLPAHVALWLLNEGGQVGRRV